MRCLLPVQVLLMPVRRVWSASTTTRAAHTPTCRRPLIDRLSVQVNCTSTVARCRWLYAERSVQVTAARRCQWKCSHAFSRHNPRRRDDRSAAVFMNTDRKASRSAGHQLANDASCTRRNYSWYTHCKQNYHICREWLLETRCAANTNGSCRLQGLRSLLCRRLELSAHRPPSFFQFVRHLKTYLPSED